MLAFRERTACNVRGQRVKARSRAKVVEPVECDSPKCKSSARWMVRTQGVEQHLCDLHLEKMDEYFGLTDEPYPEVWPMSTGKLPDQPS